MQRVAAKTFSHGQRLLSTHGVEDGVQCDGAELFMQFACVRMGVRMY